MRCSGVASVTTPITLEIPAHLQPALDRRGKEWLIEQLQAAAADDMAHTLRGYLAAKEREAKNERIR